VALEGKVEAEGARWGGGVRCGGETEGAMNSSGGRRRGAVGRRRVVQRRGGGGDAEEEREARVGCDSASAGWCRGWREEELEAAGSNDLGLGERR
jgi:hypothetical protein